MDNSCIKLYNKDIDNTYPILGKHYGNLRLKITNVPTYVVYEFDFKPINYSIPTFHILKYP